ncbi:MULTISPECIES: alpha/beta hydrolase-fold protein [unclassified Coleofasciculus]|uniref:alpha/beta hydrolase-fold protein n=1 Tax=unclassified Coleofasciculus TaxID=2692782 RepID=UPI00187FAE34|nr:MULTISPECIES: alpha/beta hydrolase [unclassified Coleofasciculus]MBE9125087.1 alpha/beta hydrolase [Coleofasciculus sp. LEGE 07081]MBE9150090.1 alpha/beta hydrolase [Coleofasciculus sp. LEGE 07092]
MKTNSNPPITPTAEQIAQTKKAIETYYLEWLYNPSKREGVYPFYQIHEAGEPIQGTVMIFHGFSAKPMQMFLVGDYLFRNGFNIYQIPLAGHGFLPPDSFWPQVDLKPEFLNPLRQGVQQDPVLDNFFYNRASNPFGAFQQVSLFQKMALVARILKAAPQLLDMALAIERANDRDFDRYFTSSHMNYLNEAKQRLAELDAMPGPIYTVGLSVGGAVALALAASRPERIKKVVTYAPLLEVSNEVNERYINLTGPLDLRQFSWEHNISFPVGCLTAANRFGAFVRSEKNRQTLETIPTFLVLTENEDAADLQTNQRFFKQLGGESKGHRYYLYPASDLVPHPMVDPREISQGMTNRFWKSLYQETFRFLTTGEMDSANMSNLEEASDLPPIPTYS